MTIGWPSRGARAAEIFRAITSIPLPAAYGTTSEIVRDGYTWASASADQTTTAKHIIRRKSAGESIASSLRPSARTSI
jgi:hypothetical protein